MKPLNLRSPAGNYVRTAPFTASGGGFWQPADLASPKALGGDTLRDLHQGVDPAVVRPVALLGEAPVATGVSEIGGLALPGPSGQALSPGVPKGDDPGIRFSGERARKRLSEEELRHLREGLPAHLKSIARPDPESKYGDLLADDHVVGIFQKEYETIAGIRPVYARDLVQLLRDHGDHLISMHMRPIPIGIDTYSAKKTDEVAIKQFVRSMFNELQDQGLLGDIALVGGLTDVGGIRASYAAVRAFPEVEVQGIVAAPGVFWPTARVDKALIFGKQWGADSPVFLDIIDNGFMVGIGGGAQAGDEARWFVSRNSDRAIIAEGFTNTGKDGTELPGAVDGVEGGYHIQNAAFDPIKSGREAGKRIAEIVRARRAEQRKSPLMQLAMEASPKQILEVEQWARANTSKYRTIRILNAVRAKLDAARVSEARISAQLTELSFNLVQGTFGIDNFAENAKWQQRAKEAIKATGGDVAAVLDDVAIDVMFASWFGIQEYRQKPGFFEENVSRMPEVLSDADLADAHTLDPKAYSEIRLDIKTAAFLGVEDAAPEVFLGTRDEMEAFYRAKGFQFTQTLHDSNGSYFYLLSNGATRLVVIHGVDSEARLAQLSALMKVSGVAPSRAIVRGSMEHTRLASRNMLELALANLGQPIAGVIIGNKGESIAALAAMAGVSVSDLKFEDKAVGPFRFRAVRVKAVGQESERLIIAFSPAYGQLSYDLVKATVAVGAGNFMLAGAGGSLIQTDKLGAIHQVTSADYEGAVVDLTTMKNVFLIDVPGAAPVRNVFSPTPLEQTKAWAERMRAKGAGDVDQESGPVFSAWEGAAAEGHELHLFTGLYQSDVVGTGALNSGTVGNDYGKAVEMMARRFYESLGIGAVVASNGTTLAIGGAQPGILAGQKAEAIDAAKIAVPLPDLGTIGDGAGLSSVQQFKGQKRVIQISAEGFGSRDRTMLRDLLHALDATKFWVALPQSDSNHGEILEIAQSAGYETILVSTTDAVRNDRVQGQPTFIIKEDSEEQVQATLAEFARDGKNDDYEANTAQHYVLHLGKSEPKEQARGHIYASLIDIDDIDEVADGIAREAKSGIKAVKKSVKESFESKGIAPPVFHDIKEIGEFINGRKVLRINGASLKSWPQISPEQQAYIRLMILALAKSLDPSKYVVVTGGTDFGPEKIAHDAFGAAGFDILGTITENTDANEVSPYIKHLVVTGINWFGMARPVAREIVEAFNGQDINLGGGDILRDMIQLHLKLNLREHNFDGPVGASTDAARDYAAHAFRTAKELFERMGLDVTTLPKIPSITTQEARWWTAEQFAWTMPKSFKGAKPRLGHENAGEIAAFCEILNRGGLSVDGSMEDQLRSALPKTLVVLEAMEAFPTEFPKFIKALQQSRDALAKHQGLAYEERLALAAEINAVADGLATALTARPD